MQTCTFPETLMNNDKLIDSDPHNPEHAKKQILSIAPIIPGQKEPSDFQIPPHKTKESGSGNGESENNAQDGAPKGEDPARTGPFNQGHAQAASTNEHSAGARRSPGSVVNGSGSENTAIEGVLHRTDSRTKSVDEFVDAEEK